MKHYFASLVMAVLFLPACAAIENLSISNLGVVTENSADDLQLTTRHRSVFNRIDYLIPDGWVVVDGESDWVAPSSDKQFWQPGFDTQEDTYFTVSVVFPHLTLDDMASKRVRSLEEIAEATLHSLQVASSAKVIEAPNYFTLNDYEAVALSTRMDPGQTFYQVLVQIEHNNIASVAGFGPEKDFEYTRSLVNAIAKTIEPAGK